ncbi:SDR family oxidoreductase [Pseudonocardia kujensis]|uniref:SDR family oxidoreductase n=1 Tax=Pseudonocardia kujensis TaxID=1128675 RepID=UPI0027E1821A|nr:SDR family oxidoreductase [Pseudonocardia kujensis]
MQPRPVSRSPWTRSGRWTSSSTTRGRTRPTARSWTRTAPGSSRRSRSTCGWAPALWAGLAWRAWMRDQGGVVVNIASVGASVNPPGLGVYGASKAALVHLTQQLAVELAPGVRVNAVAPGVVRTALSRSLWEGREAAAGANTLLGRLGTVEEVATAVAYLVSDDAAWVTGETLVMDGGERLA